MEQTKHKALKHKYECTDDEPPVFKKRYIDTSIDDGTGPPVTSKLQEIAPAAEDFLESKAHINDLPQPILLKIFGSLPLPDLLCCAGRVSQYWNTLAHDPHLWHVVDLRQWERVTDEILVKLTALSNNVTKVDITDTKLVTSTGVSNMTKQCPRLRVLNLCRCLSLKSEAFRAIGEHCHLLQQLHLDCCFALADDDIHKICQGCHQLRLLRLSQCKKVTDFGVKAIAENCPEMRTLILDQCTQVSDASIKALVSGCPHLETLSCMGCSLGTEGLLTLTKLKNLEHLELAQVVEMTDSLAIDIARHCKRLKTVNLSLCKAITDKTVEYLAKHCKLLQRLHLVSCLITDKALVILGAHCKTLTHLDVGWCVEITASGVRKISETCSTLTFLGLTRCDLISPQTLEDLVLQYPHIFFSAVWLDCKRLLQRAHREGRLKDGDMPLLAPPASSVPPHFR